MLAPSATLDRILDELDLAPTQLDEADDAPTNLRESPDSAEPPDSADPLVGSYVGNYQITRRIGSGGGGVVYEAVHCHLGRRSAIKVLREFLTGDASALERFRSEAIAASRIGHSSVVSVLDYGYDARGLAYLVMEYVDGRPLRDVLRSGPMRISRAIGIADLLATTMDAAHRAGVIHRDLKPANVLVTRDGAARDHVKILDFGVAKVIDCELIDDRAQTIAGTMLGTPMYMPPEQVRGAPVSDPRSDIYSLGCILFEMLTGRVPYTGNASEILTAHIVRPVPRPSRLRSSISSELDELVMSMLAKEPDDRPYSMAEVSSRLRRIAKLPRPWASTPARRPERFVLAPTVIRPPTRNDSQTTGGSYQPDARFGVWHRLAAVVGLATLAMVFAAACL